MSLEFPGHRFVTIALDNVTFRNPIAWAQILRFVTTESRLGNTSVDYGVEVFTENSATVSKEVVFATRIAFVNVDESGKEFVIPQV
ncbi:MAG: acyl-CoA hydrolase [Gammaproteobacteria bacterium]